MDRYSVGDTEPAYTAVLLDGSERYDASGASTVRVKVWRNGELIVDKPATTFDANGVVTLDLISSDPLTAEPGKVYGRVIVNGVQNFPPQGFLVTDIYPAAPFDPS